MQRSADVEGGRVLLGALGAWRGQRGGGWRLLGGEQVEQRLDLGVAFGDLLEVELVSREVLPQTEQVFLAIVAGQRGDQLLVRSVATTVAMDRQPFGVARSRKDGVDDLKPGYPSDVADHSMEHKVHLGQRLLHALDAGSELLDQDCALAQIRAQRHHRGGGTKAGAQEPHGNRSGGKAFSRGALYELLSNPVYIGEIRHRKERHPGQHEPIMDRELWERAQRQLRDQAARCKRRATKADPSPLAGKLFDEDGECLYVAGAAKGERRYRYYVSRHLVTGSADKVRNGWRLSGPQIERTVAVAARQLLNDHAAISTSACNLGVGAGDIPAVLEAAGEWSRRLQSEADSAAALSELVDRVNRKPGGIELSINLPLPVDGTHGAAAMLPTTQFFAMQMKRRGVEMRLIIGGADAPPRKPDAALLKAIARAHWWFEELISARATSLAAIASREGVTDRYVARLIRLAFLAPKIVEAIAERGELAELKLTPHVDLPLDWTTQKRVVGLE